MYHAFEHIVDDGVYGAGFVGNPDEVGGMVGGGTWFISREGFETIEEANEWFQNHDAPFWPDSKGNKHYIRFSDFR